MSVTDVLGVLSPFPCTLLCPASLIRAHTLLVPLAFPSWPQRLDPLHVTPPLLIWRLALHHVKSLAALGFNPQLM